MDANNAEILRWAKDTLSDKLDINQLTVTTVVETPWSMVLKLQLPEQVVFLKQTPPDLFVETEVMRFIKNHMPLATVPSIFAMNPDLCAFLMTACGQYSLRTKFSGTIEVDLLNQGLKSYIGIQRQLEPVFEQTIDLSIPNWRIKELPTHYSALIEHTEELLKEGMSALEIEQLKQAFPHLESACKAIAAFPIKETLVNCDFNENNLIMDEATGVISVIDWGESVITHPFFSIIAFIRNTQRRYQLSAQDPIIQSIETICFSMWSDITSCDELSALIPHIERVQPIFYALGLQLLQKATNNQSKQFQRWFIKDCLQLFLNEVL